MIADEDGSRGFPEARRASSAVPVIAHGALLFTLLAALTIAVPRFEAMYRDARMTIPRITQSAIVLSNYCKSYFGVVGVLAVGLLCGDWMLCRWLRARGEGRAELALWTIVVAAGLVGFGLWLLVALFMPFLGPLHNVGS